MINTPPITLRYFDCRGRGQHFRYFLRHRGVAFTDERVALSPDFSAWVALKPRRELTGPFHKLPVLQWGDQLVAETSVVHRFLHQQLGDEGRLTAEQQQQHEMLASSCYGDLTSQFAVLLWSELVYPGSELAKGAVGTLGRIKPHLGSIEHALNEWGWWSHLAKRDLMLGDFQLWEALDWAVTLFGPALQLELSPGLEKFHREFAGRAICTAVLAERPCPITARPGEAEVIARIRQAVA